MYVKWAKPERTIRFVILLNKNIFFYISHSVLQFKIQSILIPGYDVCSLKSSSDYKLYGNI